MSSTYLWIILIAVISTIAAFRCPKPNGLFTDENALHMYYHCFNWIPYRKPCPSGFNWSQNLERCISPSVQVETSSATTTSTSTTTVIITTTTATTTTATTTGTTTETTTTTATTTTATTTEATTTTTTTTATTTELITEPPNACARENPCLNGGSCEPLGKEDFFCFCTENYYGPRCQNFGERADLSELESIISGNNDNYEHTVENVLQRNNWTDILAIVDVTGSMQPCAAAVFNWMKLSHDKSKNIKYYVFFNDGDDTPNAGKVIGSTGGIYGTAANNLNKVLATMQSAMKNGFGGDMPENDIEAILRGIELCPTCKDIIHIADNQATPRDMSLLSRVKKPVKVLTCRVEAAGVNPQLLNIADKTKGSLHTLDEDVFNLSAIGVSEHFKIGRRSYRRTASGFVVV